MHIVWNDRNMTPLGARQAAAHAVDNLAFGVVEQLTASATNHRLQSADGLTDYTAGMGRIQTPIFFVAGALDQLAPPVVVAEAYRRVHSPVKRIAVIGRAAGFTEDYGHVDLAIGRRARIEVYPLYLKWLVEQDRQHAGIRD